MARSNARSRRMDAGGRLGMSERLASGIREGLVVVAARPIPVTSTGIVLAPLALPYHGMTRYSSPPPAGVMHAPSLMLTTSDWPTASATGAAEPRHGDAPGFATTTYAVSARPEAAAIARPTDSACLPVTRPF